MFKHEHFVRPDTKCTKFLRAVSRVALGLLAVLVYLSVTGKENWIIMLLYGMPTFLVGVLAKSFADDVTHAEDPYRVSTTDSLTVWAFVKFFRIL